MKWCARAQHTTVVTSVLSEPADASHFLHGRRVTLPDRITYSFFGELQGPLIILVPCESTSLCFQWKAWVWQRVAGRFAQENNNWFDNLSQVLPIAIYEWTTYSLSTFTVNAFVHMFRAYELNIAICTSKKYWAYLMQHLIVNRWQSSSIQLT
jgi:hypothetical protein